MATRTMTRPRMEVSRDPGTTQTSTPSSSAALSGGTVSFPFSPRTPGEVQRHALSGGQGEDHLTVQLLIDGSDADGVRQYDETLPISVIRAILDPTVDNFFIPIEGKARPKPRSAKRHFLHTSYIREVILLGDLPEEENT